MSKRAEKAALKAYPYDYPEREGYKKGYEQAEKNIILIIQSRLNEIQGDAQPRPILRAELQKLMIKIMEEK